MKRIFSTFYLALIVQYEVNAQACDCLSNLNWVIETFQKNDAGYQMSVQAKGVGFDNINTESCRKKAISVSSKKECTTVMLEWLHYYRPQHIGIQLLSDDALPASQPTSKPNFQNWETIKLDISTLKAKISAGESKPLEGLWQSPPYTIAIISTDDGYVGVIEEAGNTGWKKGEVKMRIQQDGQHGIYYLKDRSELPITQIEHIGKSHMRFNHLLFERSFPETEREPETEYYIKSSSAKKPFLEKINNNTILLRIPSFEFSEKSWIDSLIAVHKYDFNLYPHLIIDLTKNGGGSDASYESLLPLIYTDPIRYIQTTYYSTPFNIQEYKDYLNLPDLTKEDRNMLVDAIAKLEKHPYSFVALTDSITEFTLDSISTNPKQVAILIDEGCASTTEQFLLAARQSRKVKLYGRTTMGVLDISNMKTVESPCHEYALSYSWTRSLRLPEYPIDDIGIQPDYYLDHTIPDYRWIGYIAKKMAAG